MIATLEDALNEISAVSERIGSLSLEAVAAWLAIERLRESLPDRPAPQMPEGVIVPHVLAAEALRDHVHERDEE